MQIQEAVKEALSHPQPYRVGVMRAGRCETWFGAEQEQAYIRPTDLLKDDWTVVVDK